MTHDLTDGLHSLAAHHPSPEAPTAEILRRGRRAKRLRTMTATATVAAATVGAITLGAAVIPEDAPKVQPLSSAAPTAQPFRFTMTWVIEQGGRRDQPTRYQGTVHPGKGIQFAGPANRRRNELVTTEARGTLGPDKLTVNAAALRKLLSTRGTTTQKDATHFDFDIRAFPTPKDSSPGGRRVTGTVTLNAAGKVTRIVQRTTILSPAPEIADRNPVHFTSTTDIVGQG